MGADEQTAKRARLDDQKMKKSLRPMQKSRKPESNLRSELEAPGVPVLKDWQSNSEDKVRLLLNICQFTFLFAEFLKNFCPAWNNKLFYFGVDYKIKGPFSNANESLPKIRLPKQTTTPTRYETVRAPTQIVDNNDLIYSPHLSNDSSPS